MRRRLAGSLHWLVPGAGYKRWLLLVVLGVVLLLDAITRWFIAEGSGIHVNELLDALVVDYFSPAYLTGILGTLGIVLLALGLAMWMRRVVRVAPNKRLRQGYRIVAIGGGTGLSTLLRGLKRGTSNLTAVVTVSDDGGSSGRLQKELGVLPPGDVRNCLVALADDEALVTDLFRYRFSEGAGLSGHSFGNLFLAAMTGITGNFDRAIQESSRVLNVVGRVLPATLGVARLCAELDDGTVVEGESNISNTQRRIRRVFFNPPSVAPLDDVIAAIREADAIVLGPGSLFTSVAPNFLVSRIAREVADARGVKIYVCNVMTQPGETDNMSAADHVEALLANAGERVCDYVIVNDERPSRLLAAYAQEGQVPVEPDIERIEALGVEPVTAGVIGETDTVRHDPYRLAGVVFSIVDKTVAERATLVKPASAYRDAPKSNAAVRSRASD